MRDREEFTKAAMQAFLDIFDSRNMNDEIIDDITKMAVKIADAQLKRLGDNPSDYKSPRYNMGPDYKIQLEKSGCRFLVSVNGDYFGRIVSIKNGWQCVPKNIIKEIEFKLSIELDEIVELLNSPTRMG